MKSEEDIYIYIFPVIYNVKFINLEKEKGTFMQNLILNLGCPILVISILSASNGKFIFILCA